MCQAEEKPDVAGGFYPFDQHPQGGARNSAMSPPKIRTSKWDPILGSCARASAPAVTCTGRWTTKWWTKAGPAPLIPRTASSPWGTSPGPKPPCSATATTPGKCSEGPRSERTVRPCHLFLVWRWGGGAFQKADCMWKLWFKSLYFKISHHWITSRTLYWYSFWTSFLGLCPPSWRGQRKMQSLMCFYFILFIFVLLLLQYSKTHQSWLHLAR